MTPLLLSLLMAIATADSPAVYTSPSSTYLGSDGASLDASAFHEAVAPYHPAMLSCTDGQETTRATINVSVGAKGKTKSIVDTEQAHVVSCLREALKSLRVPEYPKGSSVRFEALIGSVEGNSVKLGSLEKTAITEGVMARAAAVKDCYDQAVAANSGLSGRVTVRWVIEETGQVGTVGVIRDRTTLKDEDFEQCLIGVVRSMTFPAPVGGIVVPTFPFDFAPE